MCISIPTRKDSYERSRPEPRTRLGRALRRLEMLATVLWMLVAFPLMALKARLSR